VRERDEPAAGPRRAAPSSRCAPRWAHPGCG
jgi:hypothetical protein